MKHYSRVLKERAINHLKGYLALKQDSMIKVALSRKFSYVRKLKSVLRLLRENIANQKDLRRKIFESETQHKRGMLARFFSVLRKADSLGKERELRLIDHLETKRKRILSALIHVLLQHC